MINANMQMLQTKGQIQELVSHDCLSRNTTLVCASQTVYNIKCQNHPLAKRNGLNGARGVRHLRRTVKLESRLQ